jgi:hypothetical protein
MTRMTDKTRERLEFFGLPDAASRVGKLTAKCSQTQVRAAFGGPQSWISAWVYA